MGLIDVQSVLKQISLILLIYFFLLAITLPMAIPLAIRALQSGAHNPIMVLLLFGLFLGVVLSTGPFVYAFVVKNQFWLKSHLTTGLAHELKTPVSVIQNAVEILEEGVNQPDIDRIKMADYVDIVRRNAARLDMYIKNLLHLAKINEGAVSIRRALVHLPSLIEEEIEVQRPLAEAKRLTLSAELDSMEEMELDGEKIQQMVSNLLSNAIKYSDKGEIRVRLTQQESSVIVSIKDEGCGINPKNLTRVFERFFQEKNS